MGLPDVFRDLIRAGVSFETDGQRLRWRNSEGRITPDVVSVLAEHKAEIVGYLQRETRPAKVMNFDHTPCAPEPSRHDADAFRHGRSVTGHPLTWTGRVVSLEAWRKLSAWEKHGPDGRLFCGACQAWVRECPHCAGGAA